MLIEKSRSGVYQDTPENRRLNRVGQHYGEAKKPEEKKGGDNVKGVEIVTSKAGIKTFLSGKVGDDYYRAVAEAHKALRRSGKSKSVDLMLKESGSGSPSKDIPAKKYVEAVNNGATHDEAVKFADDCYKEFLAKIQNVQEKVHSEGVGTSAATKMFAAVNKWFNVQKFEKKAVSESSVKKDETKQEGALPKVNLSEKDFTRYVDEETKEGYPNAKLKLHHYQADRVEYFNSEGQKRTAVPFIFEFYSDGSQSSIGGYEAYFDKADSIGTFRTKESAIAALNKYVNAMRVDGHSKPEWVYNQSKGRYQWNYAIPKAPEKQVKEVSSKVEKQPVKENNEKQDKSTSRVTFADVPRSKEVNLKKYLTDSRRKQVDYLMKAAEVMPKSTVKQMHDAAVKKFNDNFDSLKKSERASALYVIIKYKDLLNKAKSLADKNKVAYEDIVNRMSDAKVSFGSIEQILKEGAEKKSGDSGAYRGDIEIDLSGSYNDYAWKSSGRSKPKKTYQLVLHTDADAGAFNRGTLTRDQIKGATLVESNPWEGFYTKIKDVDLDDLPVRVDRK